MPKLRLAVAASFLVLLIPALAWAQSTGGAFEEQLAKGWLWAHLAVFGAGFLTSLTPCVYPMIPIVVGVFGARDDDVTRQKAFILATAYVLGMGAMYAGLGLVFALIGKQFGSILSNPWVVWPVVGIYLVLAASMFGAFEINLPASWQAKLTQVGGKGYGGAFGMGMVGGLTAAPCTGPILAGILTYVATSQNVAAGGSLLFVYALGMGVLFWVLAAFTVSLPRSGRWMEWVKSFGGIALLAVSIYFLRPLYPSLEKIGAGGSLYLLSAVVLICFGLALGAIHRSFYEGWSVRVRKAIGVVFVVVGITGIVNSTLSVDRELPWVYDEEAAFAQARAEGKGVMIDFAADWCLPCKELEKTFADGEVYEHITERYVLLKFDVSKGTETDEARQEKWSADTLPAVIFASADGKELGRVDMYLPPEQFLDKVGPATELIAGEPRAQFAPAPTPAPPATGAAAAVGGDRAGLDWHTDEATAFAEARRTGKKILIDLHGSWCTACKDMDHDTWSDPSVADVVEAAFVPLRLDVSAGTAREEALQEKYGADSLPVVLVLDHEGAEHGRIDGYAAPREVISLLTTCG
ncbi:thioredoxin family protein [Haliangium sp.]|uniref:cytochrome c biogenesis protein CcdA n=1 Tax=Haliangium sp. TaxID=2663208 RepID=UPI003D0D26D5